MATDMKLMAGEDINLVLKRISAQINERHRDTRNLALVGIKRGGDHIARRLAQLMGMNQIGAIDITLYRDDLQSIPVGKMPEVHSSEVPFEVEGTSIILVDDVLYTGRTVRAAIDELFDFGRPALVELAVLVDRGGRELPIAANYIGVTHPVLKPNTITVSLSEDGAEDCVMLISP